MKLTFPVFDSALVEEIESYLDQDYQTEIIESQDDFEQGLKFFFARGFNGGAVRGVRQDSIFARPMIQVIQDGAFSVMRGVTGTNCQCGDFAYSWKCPDHGELPWDSKHRRWIRPEPVTPPAENAFEESIRSLLDFVRTRPTCPCSDCRSASGGQGPVERLRVADLLWASRVPETPRLEQGTIRLAFDGAGPAVTYVEINGESIQGVASVRIEIEGDAGE